MLCPSHCINVLLKHCIQHRCLQPTDTCCSAVLHDQRMVHNSPRHTTAEAQACQRVWQSVVTAHPNHQHTGSCSRPGSTTSHQHPPHPSTLLRMPKPAPNQNCILSPQHRPKHPDKHHTMYNPGQPAAAEGTMPMHPVGPGARQPSRKQQLQGTAAAARVC